MENSQVEVTAFLSDHEPDRVNLFIGSGFVPVAFFWKTERELLIEEEFVALYQTQTRDVCKNRMRDMDLDDAKKRLSEMATKLRNTL